MNGEEKIKNIEEILELCREELPYNEDISATLDCEDLESLECLYKMYKQEKEKNKKIEEEIKCFRDSYEEARIEECDNYFMLNRIINLMAEDLKKNIDVLYDTNKSITDIKAYYFNKAKEIKNE